MQDISAGHHQPKSKTAMLSTIDLNSNDKTCVHSVLLFAIEQSKKLNVKEHSNRKLLISHFGLKPLKLLPQKN